MKIKELYRKQKIVNFYNKIDECKSCLLFDGNSGVGKTIFLKQVSKYLNENDYYSLYLSFNKSEKEILQELLEFAKRILSIKIVVKSVIKDLKENKYQYIRNLTLVLIKDIINLALPISIEIQKLDTYKELNVIAQKASLSEIEKQIQELEYDLFPTLLSAIQEYSNYSEKSIYIIYDQVETSTKQNQENIRKSLTNVNNNLCQILSIQKELLQSNIELYNFISSIKRYTSEDYNLTGFSKDEITEWFNLNNLTYYEHDIIKLIEITEGKPIFLEQCIRNKNIDINKIRKDVKDGSLFTNYLKDFKKEEQKLIIALCFQPQNYILTDDILRQLTNIETQEFDTFKQRLEDTKLISLDRTNNLCYVNLHYLIIDYIINKNYNTVQEIAQNLYELLNPHAFTSLQERKHFLSILLHFPKSKYQTVFEYFNKFNIEEDGISLDWIEKIKENENNLNINSKIKLNAIYAKACYLLGRFQFAIENTEINIKEQSDKVNLLEYCFYKLYRGRNYFRLSNYDLAINDIKFATDIFNKIERWDEYIECIKTLSTIHRDKSEYQEAYLISKNLYDKLINHKIYLKPTSQSYIYRNFIRSALMANKPDELQSILEKSFDVVNKNVGNINERDLANCFYTQGEYYRYNKDFNYSIESYRKAIKYAQKVNNPDTEIYSLLGICDNLIHIANYHEFQKTTKILSNVLNSYKYDKCSLEVLHFNLLVNVLYLINKREDKFSFDYTLTNDIIVINKLLKAYSNHQIIWVEKYWDLLIDGNDSSNLMKF